MRHFTDLLCKDDPADTADVILGRMMDLISSSFHALREADVNNAERVANDASTTLEILHACAIRACEGVEELQRMAQRGFWRVKPADGEA